MTLCDLFDVTETRCLALSSTNLCTIYLESYTSLYISFFQIIQNYKRASRYYHDRLYRDNREIKIHVYSIRQTANVSGEFLRIENKQLKKVQNDSCGQNYHKTTYFCVEAINGKRKIGGKLGHVVQIHVCRLA